jgi:hypothetical protein
MFYYKDLLKTLTNSTILNLAYQSIQGLNNHSQTQEQDGSSSGVSSDEASISSGSSISATTALTESISIDDSDDQDEDDPMDHVPDPNL